MTKRDAGKYAEDIRRRRGRADGGRGPRPAGNRQGITVPEARLHRMRTFRVADVVAVVVVGVLVADKYRRRTLALGHNYISVVVAVILRAG